MALRRALLRLVGQQAACGPPAAQQARCLASGAPWQQLAPGGGAAQQPPRPGAGGPGLLPQLHQAHHPPAAQPWRQQVRSMFIQTQPTPNPQSLMFLPGRQVMESGSYEFPNARAAMVSPLAKKLFAIDGVTGVFFGSDFVTVTKRDELSWPVLKPDVFAAIMDHFGGGAPLFSDAEALAASDTAIKDDDDEVVAMIKELLETRIRPAVQEDGGDIVYRGFDPDSGTVTLKMMGACSGCPSSTVTLKSGIENMLTHYIPEVKQVVEAPPDEGEEEGIKAFEELEQQLGGGGSMPGQEQQQQRQ